jgi:hypothetical protein
MRSAFEILKNIDWHKFDKILREEQWKLFWQPKTCAPEFKLISIDPKNSKTN